MEVIENIMNVLICGHIDLTQEEFDRVYVPDIHDLLKQYSYLRPTFYIGGATGTDTYAQEYIHKLGHKMVICDKGDQDNVLFPSENKVEHINGFETYIERDQYMVNNCRAMILFLRNVPYSLGSGSMRNFISKRLDNKTADEFMKYARSKEWDSVEECLKGFNMKDNVVDDIKKILIL